MNMKLIENVVLPIYEKQGGEKLVNARELHIALENKRKISDWIKQKISQYEVLENKYGNRTLYYN